MYFERLFGSWCSLLWFVAAVASSVVNNETKTPISKGRNVDRLNHNRSNYLRDICTFYLINPQSINVIIYVHLRQSNGRLILISRTNMQ